MKVNVYRLCTYEDLFYSLFSSSDIFCENCSTTANISRKVEIFHWSNLKAKLEFKSVNSLLTWIRKVEMLIKLLNIIQKLFYLQLFMWIPKQFEVGMLQRGWPSWTAGCGWTTWTNHIFIDTMKDVEKVYLDKLAMLQPKKGWCCIQVSMYKHFTKYAVLTHIYGTAGNQVFVTEILSLFSWNLVCKKCRKLDWTLI